MTSAFSNLWLFLSSAQHSLGFSLFDVANISFGKIWHESCFITILFSSDDMKSVKRAVSILGLCSAFLLSACNGDDSPKET